MSDTHADNSYTNISDLPTMSEVTSPAYVPVEDSSKAGKKVDLSNYYSKTQADAAFVSTDGYVATDNNYTTTEKNKLAGIAAGAQVNVKPNWTAASGSAAEILNKPTIPTVGTLITNIGERQTTSSGESLSGTITLHSVSKTGRLRELDLNNGMPYVNYGPGIYVLGKEGTSSTGKWYMMSTDFSDMQKQIDNISDYINASALSVTVDSSFNSTVIVDGTIWKADPVTINIDTYKLVNIDADTLSWEDDNGYYQYSEKMHELLYKYQRIILPDGWRLPTRQEATTLAGLMQGNATEDHGQYEINYADYLNISSTYTNVFFQDTKPVRYNFGNKSVEPWGCYIMCDGRHEEYGFLLGIDIRDNRFTLQDDDTDWSWGDGSGESFVAVNAMSDYGGRYLYLVKDV